MAIPVKIDAMNTKPDDLKPRKPFIADILFRIKAAASANLSLTGVPSKSFL